MFLIGFVSHYYIPFASDEKQLKELVNTHIDFILIKTKQIELTTDEKNYFDLANDWVKTTSYTIQGNEI